MDNARTPNLTPTFAEIAARQRAKARNLRAVAARYGPDTPRGRAALADAATFERIAASSDLAQAEVLAARNGTLAEFRRAQSARTIDLTEEAALV
ncbi:MAG TPA: hypothetical protein VD926_12965 [Acidimicrobiales bacterium]|nr:hypothetical protein [Acidimicrobiales bacterium]